MDTASGSVMKPGLGSPNADSPSPANGGTLDEGGSQMALV